MGKDTPVVPNSSLPWSHPPKRSEDRDRKAVQFIAAFFLVAGVTLVLNEPSLNDEGYLNFFCALVFWDAPLDIFFFQKSHPVISLLYAPVAVLGRTYFLVAHVAIASLSVYLIGRVVQSLGGPGALASLTVACSPAFIMASLSGQSNAEAVFFQVLVLFLHLRGGRSVVYAGLVAGIALWTRYELAPILLIYALYLLLAERNFKAVMAFMVFPVFYVLGSAGYHGDLLAVLHFPPNIPQYVPGNTAYQRMSKDWQGLADLLWSATVAVPVWPLLFLVRWRNLTKLTRFLAVALLVEVVLVVVFPAMEMFMEAIPARHKLVCLPLAVLLVAVGQNSLPEESGKAGTILPRLGSTSGKLALWGMLMTIAAVHAVSSFGFSEPMQVNNAKDTIIDLFSEMPPGGTVFTNVQPLALTLESRSDSPPFRFLAQYDIVYELGWLSNRRNGQYEVAVDLMEKRFLGGTVWPCALPNIVLTPDDRFVLNNDDRLKVIFDTSFWEKNTEFVDRIGPYEVRAPLPTVTRVVVEALPEFLDESLINAPCTQRRKWSKHSVGH